MMNGDSLVYGQTIFERSVTFFQFKSFNFRF